MRLKVNKAASFIRSTLRIQVTWLAFCGAALAQSAGGSPGANSPTPPPALNNALGALQGLAQSAIILQRANQGGGAPAGIALPGLPAALGFPGIPGAAAPVPVPTQSQAPAPAPAPVLADAPPPLWPTKLEFLAAAKNGEFRGLPDIRVNPEQETEPLTRSVLYILRNEYQVPPLPLERNYGSRNCATMAAEEIRRLLTAITAQHVGNLTQRPPLFFRDDASISYTDETRRRLTTAGSDYMCSTKVMGVERPHPYGAALARLAEEFNTATQAYVESERQRRISAYAQQQSRLQAEQKAADDARAQREAEARAAQQKRLDTERQRIETEQKRKQQAEKSRVSG